MSVTTHQHRPHPSPLLKVVLIAAIGIQTLALYAGITAATHLLWIAAAPIAFVVGTAVLLFWPFLATLIACASAIVIWHWSWLLALALFLPLGITNFLVGGTVGMAWLLRIQGSRMKPH